MGGLMHAYPVKLITYCGLFILNCYFRTVTISLCLQCEGDFISNQLRHEPGYRHSKKNDNKGVVTTKEQL